MTKDGLPDLIQIIVDVRKHGTKSVTLQVVHHHIPGRRRMHVDTTIMTVFQEDVGLEFALQTFHPIPYSCLKVLHVTHAHDTEELHSGKEIR